MNQVTETTASHLNVYVALAAAQAEMEAVVKGAINPAFKGEGKPKGTAYADLADVVQAVRGPLNRHGLAFFHHLVQGEGRELSMRTVLAHGQSDTRIECDVPLIVAKNDMQGMKSATTYAKRIGLESVTGVAPEDDDGNAAAAAKPDPRAEFEGDVSRAIAAIGKADNLDGLLSVWRDLNAKRGDVCADARVIKAKDDRKTALQPAKEPQDDGIPY